MFYPMKHEDVLAFSRSDSKVDLRGSTCTASCNIPCHMPHGATMTEFNNTGMQASGITRVPASKLIQLSNCFEVQNAQRVQHILNCTISLKCQFTA